MKKIGYLLLVLFVLTLAACGDDTSDQTTTDNSTDVVTGGEDETTGGDVVTTPDQTTDEVTGGEVSEEVIVLKDKDTFELELNDSCDVELTDYFSYEGNKYSYVITLDNNYISYELLNDMLTIYADESGEATVVVSLNDKSIELKVVVAGEVLAPVFDDINISYDLAYETSAEITFAPKEANGHTVLSYALKETVSGVVVSEDTLTVSIAEVCEVNVTVVCTYRNDMTVEFNVHIVVSETDLTVRDVVNGSFDNGLEGWVLEGEIGGVTENATFWVQEFPMFNVGKFFDGHAGIEANHGTLTSNTFELSATGYLTFMLGGAASEECYIKVLDSEDNVLAIYRNTEFADFKPEHEGLTDEEKMALIGNEVNVCNLVKYKADLSAHLGKEIKIVVVDNAEANFGLVFLDEVKAYHETIPSDEYVLATNQLADVTELKELLAQEIVEQGDYTAQSFAVYQEAVNNAKNQINNVAITEAKVNALTEAINNAYELLVVREIEVKEENTNLSVIVGKTLCINYVDYFNTNELSSVTFNAVSEKALVKEETLVNVQTAGFELTPFTITLEALYKGEVKQTVEITVEVLARPTATAKEAVIEENLDLYFVDKNYSVDLAANVNVIGDLELTYYVNGEVVEGTVYTCELIVGAILLDVKATYVYEEVSYEVTYAINLYIKDTTKYRLINGSFDNGLEGWILEGEIGGVTENATFWAQGFPMFNVGKFFDGHAGIEANHGTLTSNTFELSATGYLTFMLGGAANEECYIKVLDSEDNVLAIYRNTEFADFKPEHEGLTDEEKMALIGNEVNACNLVKYKADLRRHLGKEIKIIVVDNAEANFGLVFLDEVEVYHEAIPGDEYVLATNQLVDVTELEDVLSSAITEQGDYTAQSFAVYQEAVNNAKNQISNVAITEAKVNALIEAINNAYELLVVREIEVKEENTNLSVIVGKTLSINYVDYFNTNELSSVTFNAVSEKALVKEETAVSVKTTGFELTPFTITLEALYKGEVKQTVEITVEVMARPTITVKESVIEENFDLYFVKTYSVDLEANINIAGGLELTYYVNDEVVEGTVYTCELSEGTVTLNVKATYAFDEETYEVAYTVTLNVTDTTKYRVVNGSFDNGLEGWTMTGGEIGAVSENATFWVEAYPMHNVGKYFDAYGKNDLEPNQGSLTSSSFVLGGTGYISFMFGGAGNEECYIKVLNSEDEVIAIYRNTRFADFKPKHEGLTIEDKRALFGNEVFLANLVKYQADLSRYIGQELRLVVVDNASSGWGVVYFDELHTYHTEALGDEYTLAENQLANLEALNTLLANEITVQGDYTEQSFVAYQAAINNAKEQMNKEAIRQHVVDILVAQINEAYSNLAIREIEVLAADTNLSVIVDKTLTIDYTTYFNTNGLSSVTFNYVSDKTLNVEGTKLTYSSAVALEFTITLEALYKGEVKQTVELTVKVSNDPTPILKATTLTENVDTYGYENDVYTYDLSSNVINNAGLALTYYVGEEVAENGIYTHALTNLGEFELNVRVQYVIGSETLELEFALMLNLFDTTKYRLANGDFETGDLTGWTLVGPMGSVSNNTHYWIGDGESAAGFAYGKDGNYFFDAYAGGVEGKVGSLTSSTFTVGGSGYITYKIGAAKNLDQVNIQVVEAATGNILKVLGNPLWADRTDGVKSGCTLVAYKADLSELIGKEVFIRVWDNATGDYGLFFLDSVYTYYAEEPTNYNVATLNEGTGNIYVLTNGGFETGDLTGWTLIGNLGSVSNNTNYWIGDGESADGFAYGKVGDFLFDAYAGGVEGEFGTLTSSRFVIGGSGFITYKIGGAKNIDVVHIEVIDATNGNILTIIGNDRWADRTDGVKSGCTLVSYKADLSQFIGKDVYLKVVDNASGDYGLFFLDDVVTYYAEEPADYNLAVPYLTYNQYQVTNGDFEKGNLIGWTCVEGEIPGEVLNGSNYFNGNSLNKDGEWSFQAIEIQGSGYNTEGRRGIVRSSTFVLKENSKFSFKLSGGTGDVGIRVINAATGEVLGVFKNDQRADIEFGEGQLVQYHYQFENAAEVECYIEIFDHLEGGWGLVGVDSLNINVESFIEGSKLANNLK